MYGECGWECEWEWESLVKEGNAGREGSSIPGGRSSYLKSISPQERFG